MWTSTRVILQGKKRWLSLPSEIKMKFSKIWHLLWKEPYGYLTPLHVFVHVPVPESSLSLKFFQGTKLRKRNESCKSHKLQNSFGLNSHTCILWALFRQLLSTSSLSLRFPSKLFRRGCTWFIKCAPVSEPTCQHMLVLFTRECLRLCLCVWNSLD